MLHQILKRFYIVCCIFCILLLGCVADKKQKTDLENADAWVGEMTGQFEGKIKFYSLKISDTDKKIKGQIEAKGKLTIGGGNEGVIEGNLAGSIKEGFFNARFNGNGMDTMSFEGCAANGTFTGTFSETQGFGSWAIMLSSPGWSEVFIRIPIVQTIHSFYSDYPAL